ncbi:MAG: hypothetical protein OEM76_16490, partial [Gammaproteobacteria bacterium]|nr:hypothetical protein [Gammaproteobacteria bacterium]
QLHQRQVGAVVLATGFATFDGARHHGYGTHPDVVTAAEMERLLTAPGPTGGFAAKPSNEDYPNSVLYIVDDPTPFAVYTAASQIERLIAQDVSRIALLVTNQPRNDMRAALQQQLPSGLTINYGILKKVEARADDSITVSYADFSSSRIPEEQYDMVVLNSAVGPARSLDELAQVADVELSETGYIATPDATNPHTTSRPGVYVAGGAEGPTTLAETAVHAQAAAAAALAHIDERLLIGDAVVPGRDAAAPAAPPDSASDVQARIERALYAMLDSA